MPRDLGPGLADGGLVPQGDAAKGEEAQRLAADARGRVGIVVAGEPDPFAPDLAGAERRAVLFGQALAAAPVMELSPSAITRAG